MDIFHALGVFVAGGLAAGGLVWVTGILGFTFINLVGTYRFGGAVNTARHRVIAIVSLVAIIAMWCSAIRYVYSHLSINWV